MDNDNGTLNSYMEIGSFPYCIVIINC